MLIEFTFSSYKAMIIYQVVGDFLIVAFVHVGSRHPHDLGTHDRILKNKGSSINDVTFILKYIFHFMVSKICFNKYVFVLCSFLIATS